MGRAGKLTANVPQLGLPAGDDKDADYDRVRELGAASVCRGGGRREKVVQECGELASVDASLPGSKRRGVGLVIGLRPFAFSLLESLREEVAKRPRA